MKNNNEFNSFMIKSFRTDDESVIKGTKKIRYHYTSPSAFLSIIDKRQIRFTDIRYLNVRCFPRPSVGVRGLRGSGIAGCRLYWRYGMPSPRRYGTARWPARPRSAGLLPKRGHALHPSAGLHGVCSLI